MNELSPVYTPIKSPLRSRYRVFTDLKKLPLAPSQSIFYHLIISGNHYSDFYHNKLVFSVLNIHIQENFLDIYKNKGRERNWVGWLYQTHEPRVGTCYRWQWGLALDQLWKFLPILKWNVSSCLSYLLTELQFRLMCNSAAPFSTKSPVHV